MSRSLTFRSSENLRAGRGYNLVIVIAGKPQQAVHAGGGDDRQPLVGPLAALWNSAGPIYFHPVVCCSFLLA